MKTMLRLVLLGLLVSPAPVAGQTDGRFRSGVLTWTPTLTLRDAGVDSNVYDEATNPRRDNSAIVSPAVAGLLDFATVDVTFAGSADFVYFQRFTSERSVNRRASARVELGTWRIKPFARGRYFEGRERVSSEIDVRARRTDTAAGAGVAVQVTPRGTLELAGDVITSRFLQGASFRDVDLARRMNRETTGGTARFAYELTPLTRLVAEGSASRDRYTLSPAYDADNTSGRAGFEFEPDAVIRGRAVVGFHRIEPVGDLAFAYRGITASVEIGYVLLGRTRFDVRVARDTNGTFAEQPYYLQHLYGGEILHNVLGPLDVIARMSRETLDYPGIPERLLAEDTLEITRYGGAVALRPGARVHLSITYELVDRVSRLPDRSYDRRRLYTTLTYGF